MKKMCCFLLALSSVFALSGCMGLGNVASDDEGVKLTYNKKYVYNGDVHKNEAQQRYYIFCEDGTAKYHYYNYHYDYHSKIDVVDSYTTDFKYEIVEEENMVFCFYNGVTYDNVHTCNDVYDVPSTMSVDKLMYTENFLLDIENKVYIMEDFVEELPNFGK